MGLLVTLIQLFVAIAMLDVWLIRYNSPGRFRGGEAKTMVEEFQVYGLPDWLRQVVRVLKLSFGALMVIGIWVPELAVLAGIGLAILMVGAVSMHLKVKDPLYKALPSFSFLVLSLAVAYYHWPVG